MKIVTCQKLALGFWLVEPGTAIYYLAIKSCAVNKRSKGELTSAMNIHEEISEDDSSLPRRVWRKKGKFTNWKSGWIEEIDDKLRKRTIEIKYNEGKEIWNTEINI